MQTATITMIFKTNKQDEKSTLMRLKKCDVSIKNKPTTLRSTWRATLLSIFFSGDFVSLLTRRVDTGAHISLLSPAIGLQKNLTA